MRFSGSSDKIRMMIVEFFEAALFDLKKSKDYYSDIEPELAHYFLQDIEDAIHTIKMYPNASSQHHKFDHLRLKHCRRFPYTIIYHPDIETNIVYIVAIAHQKRIPNYWIDRI